MSCLNMLYAAVTLHLKKGPSEELFIIMYGCMFCVNVCASICFHTNPNPNPYLHDCHRLKFMSQMADKKCRKYELNLHQKTLQILLVCLS